MSETMLVTDAIPAVPTAPFRLRAPASVRVVGVMAVLYGCVLGLAAAVVDGMGIARVGDATDEAVLATCLGVSGMLALLMVIGGMLLMCGKRAGRTTLLVTVWMVLPLMMGMLIATAILTKDSGARVAMLATVYHLHAILALTTVGFALVMAMLLLGSRAGVWADSGRAGVQHIVPAATTTAPRIKILALLSLIFAFVPIPVVLMQILALIFGVASLGAIRRSGGALRGKGLAVAGSLMSAGFLITICGLLAIPITMAVGSNARPPGRDKGVETRLEEMGLAERLYSQLGLGPEAGDFCTTNVTELLKATKDVSPIDAATSEALMAADAGTAGQNARPYQGYCFKLSQLKEPEVTGEKAEPAKWVIFAWKPGRSDGSLLMLEASGEMGEFRSQKVDPPDVVTRDEVNSWNLESWRHAN